MKKILLGITGSVAAYKSLEIARELKQNGYLVECIITESAELFISPFLLRSFGFKVYSSRDIFASSNPMMHIELAKSADHIVIAPASANFLAKIAHGFADCLLSSVCLAFNDQLFIAPAMNLSLIHI